MSSRITINDYVASEVAQRAYNNGKLKGKYEFNIHNQLPWHRRYKGHAWSSRWYSIKWIRLYLTELRNQI